MTSAVKRDYWPTDGWRKVRPEDQGMEPALLNEIVGFASNSNPTVSGIVVVRGGYIVYEHYTGRFHEGSYHGLRSISKSVTSALVGIALRNKQLASLDQRLPEFFPETSLPGADPKAQSLTLRHMLTMTTGFGEYKPPSGTVRDEFATNDDLVATAMRRPVVHEPGSTFWYDDLGTQMMSVVLARATSQRTINFAHQELFAPLGIWPETSRYLWKKEPDGPHSFWDRGLWDEESGLMWKVDRGGNATTCCGVHLTLRELAKFGFLYLNGGAWDGLQIVPEDYVRDATRAHSPGGGGQGVPYGYYWWIPPGPQGTFYGWGAAGQFIYVVPGLDLVVAIASHQGRNDQRKS